jgi:hypothetical protein
MHPTIKPVALILDAIKDVSRRGDIVLDPFSGSTLIAAERRSNNRRANPAQFISGVCGPHGPPPHGDAAKRLTGGVSSSGLCRIPHAMAVTWFASGS